MVLTWSITKNMWIALPILNVNNQHEHVFKRHPISLNILVRNSWNLAVHRQGVKC